MTRRGSVENLAMDSIGLRLVRDLLEGHPGAAVAIIDLARDLGDAHGLLAAAGIEIGDHPMLRGTALAEFLAPTDAQLVGGIVTDARDHGDATRAIHLRDGRSAVLHLVRVDELHRPTGYVMVLVPDSDGEFAETPTPTEVEPAARVGVLHVDGSGIVTRADVAVLSVLGRTRTEVLNSSVIGMTHPDDTEAAVVHWVAAKEQRLVAHRWRSRVVRGDASVIWAELTITNRITDLGAGNVRLEILDISREVAAADALAVERALLQELTEALPVGIAKFDAGGAIQYANEQLANLLGRDPSPLVAAAVAGEIPELANAFSLLLGAGRPSCFVIERGATPSALDLEWTLRPVTAAGGTVVGGVLCVADVTEAIELRAALEERATTDALTGCLNWAGTMNCLQTQLRSASPDAGIGLLFIDLDGFKGINDRHGHAVGDRVLELVALRLRNTVRPFDKIGRLGGDEFVVVAPGLASLDDTRALAERVSAEINTVAGIADIRIELSASIGVAWAASGDADVLLAEADHAMYLVKCAAPGSGHGRAISLPR